MGAAMTDMGVLLPSYYQRREQPVSTSADIPASAPERRELVASSRNRTVCTWGAKIAL